MTELYGSDAFAPREIAQRVESIGVAKARLGTLPLLMLGGLAGAFIGLGALFFVLVKSDAALGYAASQVLGGVVFSLGLLLVVVAGAELFTGNNLLAMAWASRRISSRALLRNWVLSYLGNVLGCLGTVALVLLADSAAMGNGAVGETALAIARGKGELSLLETFSRGILCNALVCMAVWLAMGGHSVTDKILAVIFPVMAFVALGFEHSIANWFFLPFAMLLDAQSSISPGAAAGNLLAATAGNIVGGTLLVAGVYWLAYLRNGHG